VLAAFGSATNHLPAFARPVPGATLTVLASPPAPRTIRKSTGIDLPEAVSTPMYWFHTVSTCPNHAAGAGSPVKLILAVITIRVFWISQE